MLLTFTKESIEKIQRGEKWTTLRRNPGRWWGWKVRRDVSGEPAILQVYEGNPRSGGRKIGDTECTEIRTIYGTGITDEIAKADGFDTAKELVIRLAELHNTDVYDVCTYRWAIIYFDTRPFLMDG